MGTLPPGDREPTARCKALPAQRPHHPLGALGLALLQERPLGLETVGSGRREQEGQVQGGSPRAQPAQSPQPRPAWGPEPAQAPGLRHQPGSPRPEGTGPAVLLSLSLPPSMFFFNWRI